MGRVVGLVLVGCAVMLLLGSATGAAPAVARAATPPPGSAPDLAVVADGGVELLLGAGQGRRPVEGGVSAVAWSPTGGHLVVARPSRLDVVAADGTGARLVLAVDGDVRLAPRPWRPDGSALLAVVAELGRPERLVSIDVRSTGLRDVLVADAGQAIGASAYSPNGRQLAVGVVDADGSRRVELVDEPAGTRRLLATGAPADVEVAWRADGAAVGVTGVDAAGGVGAVVVEVPSGRVLAQATGSADARWSDELVLARSAGDRVVVEDPVGGRAVDLPAEGQARVVGWGGRQLAVARTGAGGCSVRTAEVAGDLSVGAEQVRSTACPVGGDLSPRVPLDRPAVIASSASTPGVTRPTPVGATVDPDGVVRPFEDGFPGLGAWSPDGQRIAHHAGDADALAIVDPDGTDRQLIGYDDGLFANPRSLPRWAPDGERVLVELVSNHGADGPYLVDVATGTVSPAPLGGVWSADGRRLAGVRDGAVRIVDASSGAQVASAAVGPEVAVVQWLPDGGGVLFSAPQEGEEPGGTTRRLDVDGRVTTVPVPAGGLLDPTGSLIAHGNKAVVEIRTLDGRLQALVETGATVILSEWTGVGLVVTTYGDACAIGTVDVARQRSVPRIAGVCPLSGQVALRPVAGVPAPATAVKAFGWSALRTSADVVLLGRSDAFADSLASAGLQGALDAPLLLTPPDQLLDGVRNELARLGASRVVVLGGPTAISEEAVAELRSTGLQVERVAGDTRLRTAVAVAERAAAATGAPDTAVVVRAFGDVADPSRGFADSLAAGALAADLGAPVLLTDTEALSAEVADHLDATPSIARVIVVGGTSAVSPAVEDALSDRGLDVIRLAGPSRAATAAAVRAAAPDLVGSGPAGGVDEVATLIVVDVTDPDGWADGFAAAAIADPVLGGGVLLAGDPSGDVDAFRSIALHPARTAEVETRCARGRATRSCSEIRLGVETSTRGTAWSGELTGSGLTATVRIADGETRCTGIDLPGSDLRDAALFLEGPGTSASFREGAGVCAVALKPAGAIDPADAVITAELTLADGRVLTGELSREP